MNNKKHLVLPPIVRIRNREYYPYLAYCQLICEVPAGHVTTEKHIKECLAKAYGIEGLEIEYVLEDNKMRIFERYPYWRMLTDRGHLHGAKDFQMTKLEQEGHTILSPKPNMDSFIVENYKEHLFDFNTLNIFAMESDIEIMNKAIDYSRNKK